MSKETRKALMNLRSTMQVLSGGTSVGGMGAIISAEIDREKTSQGLMTGRERSIKARSEIENIDTNL